MTKTSKTYFNELLDRLISLDRTVTQAYYEMGALLAAIRDNKLYELADYISFAEMVEENLSFTPSTANRYVMVYNHFRRLKYTKTEALNMLDLYGLRHMVQVLPKLNDKIGTRAMGNRVKQIGEHVVSFWVTDDEHDEIDRALQAMGATQTDTGRYQNSSEALLAMARLVNGTKKVA